MTLEKSTSMRAILPILVAALFVVSAANCGHAGESEEHDGASIVGLMQDEGGSWNLLRNGVRYKVQGAGGTEDLKALAEAGGNSIRFWGAEEADLMEDGRKLIDRAWDHGLTVAFGLWIGHERHGFDYSDTAQLEIQRDAVREAVRRYRDHPAVLVWGLGNEMESGGTDERIWKELNILARIVKDEDPNHPVMTVIYYPSPEKIHAIIKDYPELDILGINAYGGVERVVDIVRSAGWTGPVMLTEFGPLGAWEVDKTPWGAPIEETANEKAARYAAAHRSFGGHPSGQSVGSYAFVWGHKQETTATWFGMLLPTGEKLPAVDAMSQLWTGTPPDNRCPVILGIDPAFHPGEVSPGVALSATARVEEPDGDTISFTWEVVAESTDLKTGGDAEEKPRSYPELLSGNSGAHLKFNAPETPGAYRLSLIVRDGRGAASTANLPFRVQ